MPAQYQSAAAGTAEPLEARLLLHGGHVHDDLPGGATQGGAVAEQALTASHRHEHALAAAGAGGRAPTPPAPSATLAATDPAVVGQWGPVMSWPTTATHTHLLPSGKVLFFRAGATTALWDPATGALAGAADPDFNIFCSGHSSLPDGRLLVSGGHVADGVGLPHATIYDAAADTWERVPDMNGPRWYANSTALGTGETLVSGGTDTGYNDYNEVPQAWRADGSGWRDLPAATRAHDYYAYSYLTATGSVFHAGPGTVPIELDPSGHGSWSTGPTRAGGNTGSGSSVMYADGKILVAGGGDPPTADAFVLDLDAPARAWRAVGGMATPRRHMNATLLPDGQVLVTGGVSGAGFNDRATPVYPAEMWDPGTERFTTMASTAQPRWYHSTALLLPDGRVLAAGGDDTRTAEVYSPPYLFKGVRPTIDAAPDALNWGDSFGVASADAADVARVSLVRVGSVTHSFNFDQRVADLGFRADAGGSGLTVSAPARPNLAPPGYYMLFLVNTAGVPSVAKIVRVGAADPAATSRAQAPPGGAPPHAAGSAGVEAEAFDAGGQGTSWHDATPGNAGGPDAERAGADVDVLAADGAVGGHAVGEVTAGEWLEYTVEVPAPGLYALTARLSAGPGEGGTFHAEFDGVDKTGPLGVPAGVSAGTWREVSAQVRLQAGVQVLRFRVGAAGEAGLGRVDRFVLAPVAADQPPTVAEPAAASPSLVPASSMATALSVLGADDAGEAGLTYRWSVAARPAGAAEPAFSAADTNAAKRVTARFAAAGAYTLRATITDAGGGSASSEVAVTVEPPPDAVLRSSADAYVRGGTYADRNFGADATLVVKRSADPAFAREAYLRFDVAAAGGTVSGATLRVFGNSTAAAQGVPVAVYGTAAVAPAWSEAGITWNGRPAAAADVLGATTAAGGRWHEFDVTDYVARQQAAGAASVTFVLRATAGTDAAALFRSDESAADKPQLVVSHAPPPQALVVSPSRLAVPEGDVRTFAVSLAVPPAADVTVLVNRRGGGDEDLSASPDVPLTFTPANWDRSQTVTVSAAPDGDATDGSAAFEVSSAGLATRTVEATEVDAATPSPPEPLSLAPAADAYVRDGSYAGENFGGAATLQVKRGAAGWTRDSYLRFDLTQVAAVSSARLRLFGRLDNTQSPSAGFTVHSAGVAEWDEGGITWTNRPVASAAVIASGTVTGTAGAWYELDLTGFLQAEKAAGRNAVTLMLRAPVAVGSNILFDSDETAVAANRPTLVLAG